MTLMSKKTITITKEEYDALLETQQAFADAMQIKKRVGPSYENYKRLKELDQFCRERYKETYLTMVRNFNQSKGYF